MTLGSEDIYLLGYSIKDVPISETIFLGKKSHLVFDVKIEDDPVPYAAILDIDFFTDNSDGAFAEESSKSFASILIKDDKVSLHHKDFKLNSPQFFKILDIDKEWHRFEITITRENLWCPNKKCQFEECYHLNSEVIDNDLIKWKDTQLKKHRSVCIKIDGSEVFYLNYLSGANYLIMSFGNNNLHGMSDIGVRLKAIEANSLGKSSIILKNVSAFNDNDEIKFNIGNKF